MVEISDFCGYLLVGCWGLLLIWQLLELLCMHIPQFHLLNEFPYSTLVWKRGSRHADSN